MTRSSQTEVAGSLVRSYEDAKQLAETMGDIKSGFIYWTNPLNWFIEIHILLSKIINNPDTAGFMICVTIVGIWFIMLGANFPKKFLFWGWFSYFMIGMFIYPK